MEHSRVAVIGIILEDSAKAEDLNRILHEYRDFVVGRMGIPYRQKNVGIITLVIDAPHNVISALSGKIGMIKGISGKTLYARLGAPGAKEHEKFD